MPPQTDARIDAYIAGSTAFARPVLKHIRRVVHSACPEVEETMKWNFPHFSYRGLLCSMAAFKEHCAFGFWKGNLMKGLKSGKTGTGGDAMGRFSRITAVSDLPENLVELVEEAMQLNESGASTSQPKKPARPEPPVPDELAKALRTNAPARKTFEAFSPSHRREYIEWITDAKREETRARRLATALEWLAEGKARNWKYENC